jgi:HlyD family secretion protein
LRVPIGALFRGPDGGWRVFVIAGDRAEERRIEIGHINDLFGEVRNGLREGEIVAINPPGSLEDGDAATSR